MPEGSSKDQRKWAVLWANCRRASNLPTSGARLERLGWGLRLCRVVRTVVTISCQLYRA